MIKNKCEMKSSKALFLGWGLLRQFPPFRYFANFSALSKQTLAIEYPVYIWQVSPQLSCGDTCQIWTWFEESNMYFCHIENFAYGEINDRSFSNPHPWPLSFVRNTTVLLCNLFCAKLNFSGIWQQEARHGQLDQIWERREIPRIFLHCNSPQVAANDTSYDIYPKAQCIHVCQLWPGSKTQRNLNYAMSRLSDNRKA